MRKPNPLSFKYSAMYWAMAEAAQRQSVAERHKVGGVAVTRSGLVIPGWNGTVSGADNCCETGEYIPEEGRRKTGILVLHCENNIIGKATREGVSLEGAHLYITRAPCLPCSRVIVPSGIDTVLYDELHDDLGMEMLTQAGVTCISREQLNKLLSFK